MAEVMLYMKHDDRTQIALGDVSRASGYLPYVNPVIGGDETTMRIDNETGRIIGWRPIRTEGDEFVTADRDPSVLDRTEQPRTPQPTDRTSAMTFAEVREVRRHLAALAAATLDTVHAGLRPAHVDAFLAALRDMVESQRVANHNASVDPY